MAKYRCVGGGSSDIVNGIIEEFVADADTIDANTFVEFVASKIIGSHAETCGSNQVLYPKPILLDDNHIFLYFIQFSSPYYSDWACIINIEETTISYGSIINIDVYGYQSSAQFKIPGTICQRISTDKILIFAGSEYSYASAIVCSISGYTITKGTKVQLNNVNLNRNTRWSSCVLSDGTIMVNTPITKGFTIFLFTISDLTLTYNKYDLSTTMYTYYSNDMLYISDNKFILMFGDSMLYLAPLYKNGNTFSLGTMFALGNVKLDYTSHNLFQLPDKSRLCIITQVSSGISYPSSYICIKMIKLDEITDSMTITLNKNIETIYHYNQNLLDSILSSNGILFIFVYILTYTDSEYTYAGGSLWQFILSTDKIITLPINFSLTANYGMLLQIRDKLLVQGTGSEYNIFHSDLVSINPAVKASDTQIEGLTKNKIATTDVGKVWVLE